MRRTLLLIAVVIATTGCGSMPGAAPTLEGVGWRAVLVAGRQPAPGREPTLRFSNGKLMGSGGCNQIGGRFSIDGTRIHVSELGGTAMGCPAPIGEIEGAFLAVLGKAETVRFDGQNLVIVAGGEEIVLRPDASVR